MDVYNKGCKDCDINHEIERQKAIKKELGSVFPRIIPDNENFNILTAVNEIHKHTKKSSKEFKN